jgi:TatD DNase family protein
MHDSHIHLALEPLNSKIDLVIEKFLSSGGKYILTQGTDIVDFADTLSIANKYPEIIQVALGLHPTFFEEFTIRKGNHKNLTNISKRYIDEFEEIFKKNISSISAVGESGLDYYQINLEKGLSEDIKEEILQIQKISFQRHLTLAKENNLPISIHARDELGENDCVKDVIRSVADVGRGLLRGSFHSYTGNIDYVDKILDLGFYVGFNAIITYKSGEDVREILKKVPVERVLFETDGPFLPPQSVRKDKKIKEKFAQPSDIREIIQVAAEIKDISIEQLERITDENYENLFIN